MDQKTLKKFIERRHPEYKTLVKHWDFLNACYKGGREWFKSNIFRYLKEGDREYKDRLERAYRFNHTREIVDLVDKYLFKAEVSRSEANVGDQVKEFWKKSTRNGLPIDQFARQMSKKSSIFGSEWVVVDADRISGIKTEAERKQSGARIYAYTVDPENVLDFAYDAQGDLLWILIYELGRDDDDPFTSSGDVIDRYRLWTRTGWTLFRANKDKRGNVSVVLDDEGIHDLGEVPVFRVDNYITDELWAAPSLVGDIAYLDRAAANYLSNLDAIIQDQTFSQLAMPAQSLLPGEDGYNKMVEMGTKRIFLYDGEKGNVPFYLSPDPKQANVILGVVSKIINEIYHSVGMAGERTKQDNAMGIDNSSGVAKAFDFERVNALLVSKAASLEMAEKRLIHLVNKWANVEDSEVEAVKYSRTFDTRGLYDELDLAARLALVEAPDTLRREQMKVTAGKLLPIMDKDVEQAIDKELKQWPPKPVVAVASSISGQMSHKSGLSVVGKENQQGQNNGQSDKPGQNQPAAQAA